MATVRHVLAGLTHVLRLRISMDDTPLFDSDLHGLLNADPVDYHGLRRHIIRSFNQHKNQTVPEDCPNDSEQLLPVVHWIRRQLRVSDSMANFYNRKVQRQASYFETLSGKVNFVSQFDCPLCRGGYPILNIPIRIKPQSHQSAPSEIKRAFKAAIAHRFRDTNFNAIKNDVLCIMITFVISEERVQKDVDNLPKLLLDSLQGFMFENDRQIDHLNSIQLRWNGDEEWIMINVRRSDFNSRDDTFYRGMRHDWAGANFLDLESFMDT